MPTVTAGSGATRTRAPPPRTSSPTPASRWVPTPTRCRSPTTPIRRSTGCSARCREATPLLDFVTGDGTRQRVWRVDAGVRAAFQDRLDRLGALYVTDGHHRTRRRRPIRPVAPGPRCRLPARSRLPLRPRRPVRRRRPQRLRVQPLCRRCRRGRPGARRADAPTLTVHDLDPDADPRPGATRVDRDDRRRAAVDDRHPGFADPRRHVRGTRRGPAPGPGPRSPTWG